MVLINLKLPQGDQSEAADGFLLEASCSTLADDLISSLVEVHNLRLRSRLISESVRALAEFGPMNEEEEDSGESSERVENGDPSGRRCGRPPEIDAAESLKQVVLELEDYVSASQVQKKTPISSTAISGLIENIKTAVGQAYQDGLPKHDLARIALEEEDEDLREKHGVPLLDEGATAIWSCNKEFARCQPISHRVGTNEKTKVIVKLATKGGGPPAREPIVSEAERNAMAAFYFKRQEQLKELAKADEDDYLNSSWADPKGMKKSLQGLDGGVKAPGLRFG